MTRRFGINLRGDLAKLGDGDLAQKFENGIAEREKLYSSLSVIQRLYHQIFCFPAYRGLLRARIIYEIQGWFDGPSRKLRNLHVLDCELQDMRDEIETRLKQRGRLPEPANPS